MTALEVSLNGHYLLTAGFDHRLAVVSAILELDRGVPGFAVQAWEFCDHTNVFVHWPVPRVKLGDCIRVKIVENERLTPPSGRWRQGEQPEDLTLVAGWSNYVQKWRTAVARGMEAFASHLDRPWMTGLNLDHNGQTDLSAATPGDDGYLYWIVDIEGGILNNIMKGIDSRAGEGVTWSPRRIRVGDEVSAEILRTRAVTPPQRTPLDQRWLRAPREQ